jgi:hypothetical protein
MNARRATAVLVLAALSTAAGACGDDRDTSGATSTTTSSTNPSTSATASTAPDRTEVTAAVFFVRGEKVAAGGAPVSRSAPARGALEALLAGPDAVESAAGMTTEIPAGTRLLGVDIRDGRATVDLSGEFASGGGSLSMQLRVAQVVLTLTSFDTIERVSIRLDGRDVEAIGGEGVPARDLGPAEVEAVTPFVLVTSPLPGDTVSSPFTISGISNTFEATVQYEVIDGAGTVLDQGFTTATAGNGTWGTFSVSVELPAGSAGPGTVRAFQTDMESGGRRDLYEVPVTFR